MLQPEELLVHMFGSMVLKRLNIMHILMLPIMNQLPKRKKCKSKMKQTKLFSKGIQFTSISKTRKLLRKSSDSTFIKEVLFQVTQSELLTLKVLMLKHAVVLMQTIHQKLDGLRSLRLPELVMVFWEFISWQERKLWNHSTNKLLSSTSLKTYGESRKMKSYLLPQDSSMTIKNLKRKLKTKRCRFWVCKSNTFQKLRMINSWSKL